MITNGDWSTDVTEFRLLSTQYGYGIVDVTPINLLC